MKWIIALAFVGIAASLISGMVFLVRDKGQTKNVVWALTVRVSLSIALFAFIWFSHYIGWIQSTGIPMSVR
jgi:Protein of unknown function (DUF2909)